MEYNIKTIKIGKSHVKYIPEFKDSNIMLTHFLCSEVTMFSGSILDSLQSVVSGKSEYREFAGNSCKLIVGKNNSIIRGNIDEMDLGHECIINTEELMDLIIHWLIDLNFLKNK